MLLREKKRGKSQNNKINWKIIEITLGRADEHLDQSVRGKRCEKLAQDGILFFK